MTLAYALLALLAVWALFAVAAWWGERQARAWYRHADEACALTSPQGDGAPAGVAARG